MNFWKGLRHMNQNNIQSYQAVQNHLKKSNTDIVEIIGIITTLIITKDVFKKNLEVKEFLSNALGVDFPSYVIRSRTLMAARTSRLLFTVDEEKLYELKNKIFTYIKNNDILDEKNMSNVKKTKKKNENQKLEKWLKGL
nr:MAG TPA: hypothetical protein [Caudoviricetes sp.]